MHTAEEHAAVGARPAGKKLQTLNAGIIAAVLCAALSTTSCRGGEGSLVDAERMLSQEHDQVTDQSAKNSEKSDSTQSLTEMNFAGTVLSSKSAPLRDGGQHYMAAVVRYVVDTRQNDFSDNPCDLVILQQVSSSYHPVARNRHIVDCTNIIFSRQIAAQENDLDSYLSLDSDGVITYVNEYPRSTSGYAFAYSEDRNEWHLTQAWSYYSTYDIASDERRDVEEVVKYPTDIPYISFTDFHPIMLEAAFRANRVVD